MFRDTSEIGGKIGQHAWIVTTIVDMAAYAERNGLMHLSEQLCRVLATAMTGELVEQSVEPDLTSAGAPSGNVVQINQFPRRNT